MGILGSMWKTFKEDMAAIPPDGFKWYENKKTGEVAFQIKNKPNRYVPINVSSYENDEVSLFEATNDEPTLMEMFFGGKKKCQTKQQLEDKSSKLPLE